MQIIPSILSANLLNLYDEIALLESFGIDMIHIDIMDFNFVPNLSFGTDLILQIREKFPNLFLDVHLMTNNTIDLIDHFACANRICIHIENDFHIMRTIQKIQQLNIIPSIAINPGTPIESIIHLKDIINSVLIMSVNPGFGGQKFLNFVKNKIKKASSYFKNICIDGGINIENAKLSKNYGATEIVVGSFLFKQQKINYEKLIKTLTEI